MKAKLQLGDKRMDLYVERRPWGRGRVYSAPTMPLILAVCRAFVDRGCTERSLKHKMNGKEYELMLHDIADGDGTTTKGDSKREEEQT